MKAKYFVPLVLFLAVATVFCTFSYLEAEQKEKTRKHVAVCDKQLNDINANITGILKEQELLKNNLSAAILNMNSKKEEMVRKEYDLRKTEAEVKPYLENETEK